MLNWSNFSWIASTHLGSSRASITFFASICDIKHWNKFFMVFGIIDFIDKVMMIWFLQLSSGSHRSIDIANHIFNWMILVDSYMRNVKNIIYDRHVLQSTSKDIKKNILGRVSNCWILRVHIWSSSANICIISTNSVCTTFKNILWSRIHITCILCSIMYHLLQYLYY